MSRGETPYRHRGKAMDAERDYAANDGRKKSYSSLVLFLLLFHRAIYTPGQPALARATGRVDQRLVTPPTHSDNPYVNNHEVPYLCAGLVHGVHSSLPLGCGSGDIGYTGKRDDWKDYTVMKRLRGRRRRGWSRVWSLGLGCASYPTSKPHLSIYYSFLRPWGCCEVRCELEN